MYKIEVVSKDDFVEIGTLNYHEFGFGMDLSEWIDDLYEKRISTKDSLKMVDEDGCIIGYLLVTDCTIDELTSGIFSKFHPECASYLNQGKFMHRCFYCLNILEPCRGQGLSRIMIEHVLRRLLPNTDYIFLAVGKHLVTHTLWKKFGAIGLGGSRHNKFYILSDNEGVISNACSKISIPNKYTD